MKKAFIMIIFICTSLFLYTAQSGAELKERSYEVSPFFGYCTGATSRALCHKDFYGVRLGYVISKNWEVEGVIEGVGSNAATMLHADALFHFTPEKKFNPFILAGIGGAQIRPQGGNSYDTVMGNIGAGFKYQLYENIAFRTELREVITHSHNSVITAGLTFSFGGKSSRPASPETLAPTSPKSEDSGKKKIESAPASKPESGDKPDAAASSKSESLGVPVTAPTHTPKTDQGKPIAGPHLTQMKITLEDINLDFGKASLTETSKGILNRNIIILKENPEVNVLIEGHACAHGNEKYNMRLSAKRADVVKKYLIKHGISTSRIKTIAYGETRLLTPEIPTKKNRNDKEVKANRRVHIEAIEK